MRLYKVQTILFKCLSFMTALTLAFGGLLAMPSTPAAASTLSPAPDGKFAAPNAPANGNIPFVVTPINEARAAGVGWTGTIEGNVTVVPGTFATRSFAIQDATGGLYIYPAYGTILPPMVLGDVVRVTGTIANYNGLLEVTQITSVTWINSGTVPAPEIVSTGALAPTQGKLVQIHGTVTSMTVSGSGHWTLIINDGSGQTTVYVYKMTGINMSSFSVPMEMRVTGMSGAYGGPQVNPRYQSDIIDLRPPTVTGTNPANGANNVSLYRPLTATFNKPMNAATFDPTTFTVAGAPGTVSYNESSRTATFTPAAALSPTTTYTATLTTGIQDIYNIPLAAPYSWHFTTGAADLTPPAITGRSPAPDAISVTLSTNIVISFTEDLHPASLNLSHFIFEGPYGVVPSAFSYNPSTFVVTLEPDVRLLPTSHYTMTVLGTTADWAGLTLGSDSVWFFETSVEPPMHVYYGDLHNHTSFSDGSGTPAQALAAGEAAGFDFMAITDHSYAIDDGEWATTLAAVNAATTADFLALRGFEYTQGAEGHINVYNSVRHATRTNMGPGCTFCDYTPNLEAGVTVQGFYPWVAVTGTVGIDAAGTVMQFNHPGWINFNDWAFHPEASAVAKLEEVGNGNGSSYAFSEDEYIRSLDYGWKVGATNNADTHTADWGLNTDHRTGVLMPELSKTALLEALRERRTFASEDKNYTLRMRANGAWMGSEIANSGQILFEIDGSDPDGELTTLVQLITDQGQVAAEFEPNQADFTWQFQLDITTGVHYFYVRVVQTDGDRIVTSPVWTIGTEDLSITDIVIQPTIPTIYSPSLLTARVTNRIVSTSRTVTVTMAVNGVPLLPSAMVTVPPNNDVYANFSWQPTITGEVTVTAQIVGAPATDNPDDNSASLKLTVTDEMLPLILIDAGHGNTNAVGREMRMFIDDLSAHKYNVLKNLDALTASDLNPDVVKLLLITAPQTAYTDEELNAIADFVDAGGSLWLCGLADYTGKVPWAATVADRLNAIIDHVEQHAGTINMRMNDDEVIDANTNNGYVFGVIWGDFPGASTTSIGLNVEHLASWSLGSLRGRAVGTPLTASTPGVQIVVQGDMEEGYGPSPYYNPNHTSNTDADGGGDAYIYNPTWVYPATKPAGAIPLPMAAVTQLPDGAGRIMLYGDSNDPFTTFAYTAGDGKQNELFNLESVMWLLGQPLQKSTIAQARAQAVEDQPDNLDRLVWVEGYITAAYGEFFNMLTVQDDTGGISVHAPAGDINAATFTRGTKVRVVGTVGIYNGDTEIEFFEAEMVQVIDPGTGELLPLPLSTYQASLEENEGWLGVVTGTVITKVGNDTLFVDDGSGPIRIFLDGYNGVFDGIEVNDLLRVTGLVSEDGNGPRIRVRNYQAHPQYADDVVKLVPVFGLSVAKTVTAPQPVLPGSLLTYTLVLTNTGTGNALQVALTDTLPAGVTFGSFVAAGGAVEQDGTLSWAGNLNLGRLVKVIFTASVDLDYSLYGDTITNTVEFISTNAGAGSASAAFTLVEAPELSIAKSVELIRNPSWAGDAITYTVALRNTGPTDAIDVHLVDMLPVGVVGSDLNVTVTVAAGEAYTVTIPAAVASNPPYGELITNTASFTSSNAGAGSDTAAFTVVGAPVLGLTKSVELARNPAWPGDVITYTIALHNTGPSDAFSVHLVDVLPVGVIGSNVDVTVTLAAGAAYTVTLPAAVSPNAPFAGTITNHASFTSANAGSGSASIAFTVVGAPVLGLTKSVELTRTPAWPGDAITYTLALRNTGPSDAFSVHLVDVLPVGVIGSNVDVTMTLAAGAAFTLTLPAAVASNPPYGETITNTASFTSANAGAGSDTAAFTVVGAPMLSITKTVQTAHTPAQPGDAITYTIVLTNSGASDAVDVNIVDTLPAYVVGSNVNVTVTVAAGASYVLTIHATLAADAVYGVTITNTAVYHHPTGSDSASAEFMVINLHKLFLPFVFKLRQQ